MGLFEKIREFFEPHVEVTIVKGDSMWAIAERFTGDGERWRELADVNPGLDPHLLPIGGKMKIPAEFLCHE